eukprot:scaffold288593_cov42-Prasinocladus_malaysianus.AAC.1
MGEMSEVAKLALLELDSFMEQHEALCNSLVKHVKFDVFQLSAATRRPLFTATMVILRTHDVIARIGVNEIRLAEFLLKIEEG